MKYLLLDFPANNPEKIRRKNKLLRKWRLRLGREKKKKKDKLSRKS